MAGTLNLLSPKSRQGANRDVNVAIFCRRKTHLDKLPSPTTNSSVDLSAKTAVPDLRAVLGNNLSVEPGRTIAGNLPVEVDGRERPYSQAIAALAEVVSLSTCDNVLRDLPIVGIDSLDKASPAQCLQASDMGTHERFGVLALPLKAVADTLQVPARPVDAVVLPGIAGNVAVGRSWTGDRGCCFNDHVPPDLLDPTRILELHVMDPAIDAIDD